ncbi:uncharacterized protein ASPGLDRAFT_41347 [Aspergillus glaucus CBS 516.65]|uniref:Uncharacterized protein n=1 Tax=Aspergillus glaucus CBS 516.65 TaxID=1160497 RepID=A0A1L9VZM6_ASPGL|nr:hypothetical protein ASPGLDRAFT_41347 [Aspergillus glaucus CBS 516.65]OJJ89374.1 hypothetical protein ASPGLDRAFT_41347 [Aspergillus glaucus CBS 516.65]
MGLFSGFCCCFPRSQAPTPDMIEQSPARPVPLQSGQNDHSQNHVHSQFPIGMVAYTGNLNIRNDEGYAPTTPLPRYTPRPMSIQEKAIEGHMHMRSSSELGPESNTNTLSDEKQRHLHEYDHRDSRDGVTADDVSSAFSFQSSYGNTSTATRETPPPPYSAGVSPTPSRRTTVSVSSAMLRQQQMVNIAQPQPVFQRPEWMVRSPRCSVDIGEEVGARRFSWESR